MKKIVPAIIIIFINILSVPAAEYEAEIKEYADIGETEYTDIELENRNNNSILDYLSNVYYGKIENEKEVSPVLRLFSQSGMQFENSFINSVKLNFIYSEELTYSFEGAGRKTFTNGFGAIEPKAKIRFNNNKTEFVADYNITRNLKTYNNDFSEKISMLYIAHDITPNQRILLGQGERLPSSKEGSTNLLSLKTVNRGLAGRYTGNARSVGIRNIADYKYLDYDIGIYDSTRYFHDFGKGTDFTGHVTLKPFGINDESKTNLKLGAGYNIGKNDISYNIYSFVTEYDYKKLHLAAEYINADGSNGIIQSRNKQDGMYTYLIYDIAPKLSIIGKYDTYTPDKHTSRHYINEYTAGIIYKPYQNMKILLNYVKSVHSHGARSDMILFATRFII